MEEGFDNDDFDMLDMALADVRDLPLFRCAVARESNPINPPYLSQNQNLCRILTSLVKLSMLPVVLCVRLRTNVEGIPHAHPHIYQLPCRMHPLPQRVLLPEISLRFPIVKSTLSLSLLFFKKDLLKKDDIRFCILSPTMQWLRAYPTRSAGSL